MFLCQRAQVPNKDSGAKTIEGMVFGTRVLKEWVLGPSGFARALFEGLVGFAQAKSDTSVADLTVWLKCTEGPWSYSGPRYTRMRQKIPSEQVHDLDGHRQAEIKRNGPCQRSCSLFSGVFVLRTCPEIFLRDCKGEDWNCSTLAQETVGR